MRCAMNFVKSVSYVKVITILPCNILEATIKNIYHSADTNKQIGELGIK